MREETLPFCFRYRVRMAIPPQVSGDDQVALCFPGLPRIDFSVQTDESSLIGKWVIFRCCGFQTRELADSAGQKFGDALLASGATNKYGIDIGLSRTTTQWSTEIHEAIKRETGRDLRADVHGLMTYEKDSVSIWKVNGRLSATVALKQFNDCLAVWLGDRISFNERQRNCAALINDSFFVANIEGQFILRISAVEALCDPSSVGAEYGNVIHLLEVRLATIETDEDTRESVAQWLKDKKKESLRQSYMVKFSELVSREAALKFDRLYKLRSKLVHDGIGRGQLAEAANEALELSVAVYQADVQKSLLG